MLIVTIPFLIILNPVWHINLSEAKTSAQKEHKYILLNFSGSDWCGPCIRMKKEIFESEVFKQMADTELILVNADFPRNKKNQLAAEQQRINDATADLYNPQGKFPFTILLNEKGVILGTWEGLPDESPEVFVEEVRNHIYTASK
jgi:thioredoxin-related protein